MPQSCLNTCELLTDYYALSLSAFRATVECFIDGHESSEPVLPPIEITISSYPPTSRPASTPVVPVWPTDHSPTQTRKTLCIRIRDFGGGIFPEHLPNIFSYSFTTVGHADFGVGQENELNHSSFGCMDGLRSGLGRIAGLGYGCVIV